MLIPFSGSIWRREEGGDFSPFFSNLFLTFSTGAGENLENTMTAFHQWVQEEHTLSVLLFA